MVRPINPYVPPLQDKTENITRLVCQRLHSRLIKHHRELKHKGRVEDRYFTALLTDPFHRPRFRGDGRQVFNRYLYLEILKGVLSAFSVKYRIDNEARAFNLLRVYFKDLKTTHTFNIDSLSNALTEPLWWDPDYNGGAWRFLPVSPQYKPIVNNIIQELKSVPGLNDHLK